MQSPIECPQNFLKFDLVFNIINSIQPDQDSNLDKHSVKFDYAEVKCTVSKESTWIS